MHPVPRPSTRRRVRAWTVAVGLLPLAVGAGALAAPAASPDVAPGTYVLANACSGKVLDVRGASRDDGAGLLQWSAHGGANQQWRVEPVGDGYHRLTAVHSDRVLGVDGPVVQRGTGVQQRTDDGSSPTQWLLTPDPDGGHVLTPRAGAGQALDVTGASRADGAVVRLWDLNGTCAQAWDLRPVAGAPAPAPDPAPAPVPAPPAAGVSGPPGGTAGWRQTFSDDFDAVDPARWDRGWSCSNGQPLDCFFFDRFEAHYPDRNAYAEGGNLVLRTVNEPGGDGKAWTSGAVSTARTFRQQYGYFEVRMRPDSRPGGDPAFWLASTKTWPPEIDIAEVPGAFRGTKAGNVILHAQGVPDQALIAEAPAGTSFNDDFHTFGLLWEPGRLTGYLDGVPTGTITSHVPAEELYVILSDEIRTDGGAWFGDPRDDTSTRTTEVDHLRVWQRD